MYKLLAASSRRTRPIASILKFSTQSGPAAMVTHITDVEGNKGKFFNAIAASSCIVSDEEVLRFTNPVSQFVFGGDAVDKGPHSIRIMKSLVSFKTQEPDRVHLLVGNREAKMTRIYEEMMNPAFVRRRLIMPTSVFWELKKSPYWFVEEHMRAIDPSTNSEKNYNGLIHEYISSLSDQACQTLYLKWMLEHTMGCGPLKPGTPSTVDTFNLYKQELAEMKNMSLSEVSDEDVTAFLMEQVKPGGVFHSYLSTGVLAHRIEDTLFLHGAITPVGIGYVPDLSHSLEDAPLDTWLAELNGWFSREVDKWTHSEPLPASVPPGDTPFMKYMVFNPKSATTTNWYDHSTRQIRPLSDKVAAYLVRNGIKRVMSGHQPFSDCPLVMKDATTGLEIIVGDTSYSDPGAPHDNQGVAYNVCEVFKSKSGGSNAVITVRRKSGVMQVLDLSDPPLSRLGTVTEDGVIRLNENGDWVVSQLKGFSVEDKLLK
jgi:hypothetical protein